MRGDGADRSPPRSHHDFTLLTDRHEPETLDPDLLCQRPAVDTLVEAVKRVHPPTCIALYGRWGSGKTSILQMARRKCRSLGLPTVWFDPWEYERQGDCLSPLVYRVAHEASVALRDSTPGRMRLRSMVETALTLDGNQPASVLGQPGDLSLEAWAKRHREIDEFKSDFAHLVRLILERAPRADRESPDRIAILLDDLDRCLPETVIRLLESIKLLMCGDTNCRAVFVFALDRDVVSRAVRSRFGESIAAGERYLEKIFDFSLEVPLLRDPEIKALLQSEFSQSPEMVSWLDDCFSSDHTEGIRFVGAVLSQPIFSNPRIVKRTLNRLGLLLLDPQRRDRVRSIRNSTVYRILISWCAGAERFRPFRRLFFEMSALELEQLYRTVTGQRDRIPTQSHPTLAWLISLPDFLEYCHQLGLSQLADWDALEEQRYASPAGSPISTLYDVESLLRSAGL